MTKSEWKDVIAQAILNVHEFASNKEQEETVKCLLKSLYDAL